MTGMAWAMLFAYVGIGLCGMAAIGNVLLFTLLWKRVNKLEEGR